MGQPTQPVPRHYSAASTALGIPAIQAGHAAVHFNRRFGVALGAQLRAIGEVAAAAVILRCVLRVILGALFLDQLLLVLIGAVILEQADDAQMVLDNIADFRDQ